MRTDLSPHVVAMIQRPLPSGCHVVPGSTPVVAFGDPTTAEVATLGINPSWAEFQDVEGRLLQGGERRLADAVSLDIEDFRRGDAEQVQHIAQNCFTYFQRQPYWRWFRPLEKLLAYADLGSYAAATACHLDLVQWATRPVWSKLPKDVRERLLEDGVPHLRRQLRNDNIRCVLLNGRAVLDHVEAVGLVRLEEVGTMLYSGDRATKLYSGEAEGVALLGWSVNIQGVPGANADVFLQELGRWIASRVSPPTAESTGEGHGAIPGRPRAEDIDGLAALLERWLREDELTIGDVGRFGGKGWLYATVGRQEVVLNADTKRPAVEEFVHHVHAGTAVLRVIANRNELVNKVVFRPDGKPTPGWYCYTSTPLDAPQEL